MQKIMFNDKFGLTKAVLDGIKTKTRRIITIDEEDLTLFQTIYYNQAFDFLEGKDLRADIEYMIDKEIDRILKSYIKKNSTNRKNDKIKMAF